MVKTYKVGAHISKEPDLILEEQLLLSPGLWKGVQFTPQEIMKGIERTNWNDPEINCILGKHPEKGELPSSEDWIGTLKNVRYLTLEEGVEIEGMYADAYLYDSNTAKKLAYGKAKLAFSIDSPYRNSRNGATDLYFNKTALVYRGGCKDATIQLSDSKEEPEMRFVSSDINIQLEEEVTDNSSKGDEGTEHSNQKTKKCEACGGEIKLEAKQEEKSDSNIITKGETNQEMKNDVNTSVQLEESKQTETKPVEPQAPVVTPAQAPAPAPVTTPAPAPVVDPVTTPVVEPTPVPAKAVQESVQPVKEVVDNSKEIGELKEQIGGFESKMIELKDLISKMVESKKEVPAEPVTEPVKTEPVKPAEVKKAAISHTAAHVEGNLIDDQSNMTPFEKAHARINSKK